MAKRSKGPRKPRVRVAVTAVRPVLRPALNTAFPPAPRPAAGVGAMPVVHHRSVVHHIHHVGPQVRAGGALVPGVAPPLARPLAPALPGPAVRPPVPAGPPVGPPPGPFQVPQPPMGAPGAPLPGAMGPMGPRRPFRGF